MKMTNIKLKEVSLVDKPANKKKFLFFKSQEAEMEINVLTSMPMKKRQDDGTYYNTVTGTFEKRHEEDVNLLTGEPLEPVEKSTGLCWPTISGCVDDEEEDYSNQDDEHFEKFVPIFPVEKGKDEHIVAGVVYSPDEVDAQGDQADEEEIRKAAYHFMENVQRFKTQHKGKHLKVKILESYIAPQTLSISGQAIRKGSWILVTRVLDNEIWKLIKSGKLTGYSMAGYAKAG